MCGYFHVGAGEASADVPEGEENKVKDDDAIAEGIVNNFLTTILKIQQLKFNN